MTPEISKPKLRGVLHQYAAFFALGAGLVLVSLAPTPRALAAGAIFALSLVTLFGISATYHRILWSERARARMRRLDHASIFILIAGTYTPVAMLGLPSETGTPLLFLAWGGALLGVALAVFWVGAPKVLNALLAVAVGWTMVPYFGQVRASLQTLELVLLMVGGVAYTLGAVAYAAKRPNPLPGVFGYHEVFHAMTLVGAAAHFATVVMIIRRVA